MAERHVHIHKAVLFPSRSFTIQSCRVCSPSDPNSERTSLINIAGSEREGGGGGGGVSELRYYWRVHA